MSSQLRTAIYVLASVIGWVTIAYAAYATFEWIAFLGKPKSQVDVTLGMEYYIARAFFAWGFGAVLLLGGQIIHLLDMQLRWLAHFGGMQIPRSTQPTPTMMGAPAGTVASAPTQYGHNPNIPPHLQKRP